MKSTNSHKTAGFVSYSILVVTAVAVAGYLGASWVGGAIGPEKYDTGLPYFTGAFALFLAPLYALFNKLSDLKSLTALSSKEKRRVDEVISYRHRRMVGTFVFYLVSSLLFVSVRWWSGMKYADIAGNIAGSIICVALLLAIHNLFSMVEVDHFARRIERRKQQVEAQAKLLERMAGKT